MNIFCWYLGYFVFFRRKGSAERGYMEDYALGIPRWSWSPLQVATFQPARNDKGIWHTKSAAFCVSHFRKNLKIVKKKLLIEKE